MPRKCHKTGTALHESSLVSILACKSTYFGHKQMNIVKKNFSALLPQKNPPPRGLLLLLVIVCLVIAPTVAAVLSPSSVFFNLKAWGIEYQFEKGDIIQRK